MSTVTSGPLGVVSTVIAVVAVVALVAVLILLAKQRAQVRRANELLELSRELRHRYDALQAVTKEGVLIDKRPDSEDDPFVEFVEWLGAEDEEAFKDL